VTAIDEASDREQIFELLLRAARSKTRFAALLTVHAEHLRGRKALADDGFDTSQIEHWQLPRNAVPAFEAVIASRSPAVGKIATGDQFIDGYLEGLGGVSEAAFLLPILLAGRTVALVLAHRGDAPLTIDEVADLGQLVTVSSRALSRVLAGRGSGATPTVARPPSEGYDEVEVGVPTVATVRAAVTKARREEAWEELAEALRELIREGTEHGDPDEDEQLELLFELGRVEAERLGRVDRAIEAWRSAQTIDAAEPRVLDALEALFVQQGQWHECVELLEKRIALTEDKRPRILMLANLASLVRERLDDDERAIEIYEKILALEPTHEVAAQELEPLYAQRERWQPLATLLLDRAQRTGDVDALKSVATIYEDKLEDPRAAFLVWITVLRRQPDGPHLLEQLDRLAPAANAWDELLGETQALASDLTPQHPQIAARLWHVLGQWHRDHRVNRDEAVRSLERSLQLDPDNLDALTELLEILRSDHRWHELIPVLSQRAEAETDPSRRSELYAELGDIYELHVGAPPEAIACYERARADEPDAMPILVALHRLYLADEAWEALADLLPKLIEALGPNAPRAVVVDLLVEHGSLLHDHLGKSDEASAAFHQALALDPRHAAAHQGLQKLYQKTGRHDALLDAREAEVDDTAPEDRAQRYAEIANAWHHAARFDRAAATWQKLLASAPADAAARAGLESALRAGEQWRELAAALRAHAKIATDRAHKVALLGELGDVLEQRLVDIDGAIAAYQELVALDGGGRSPLLPPGPAQRAAADALGRLHERAGHWQQALDVLQRLLEGTTEPRARGDLFARIGQVQLAARDATAAQASFGSAIGVDPTNAAAHEGVARVYLQQGKLVAAGEELMRASQLAPNQGEVVRLLVDAAWVYRHRLDDAERARACLQRILALEPEHGDAKQALAELLQDTREWETLWPHLEEQVQRAPGMAPPERLDIFTRAARCAVELGKFAQAIELYDQALSIDQNPTLLLERAVALHRSGALDAAAASYQTIATRHGQSLERAQLVGVHRQLARIHTELGKLPQAQMFHNKVLELAPNDRETLEELVELHLARGHVDEAIAALRGLVAAADPAGRIPLLERIGDLYRDKVANPPRAMSTYMEALELDAGNRRILQRLLDLQSEQGQWKAAVETINRFLDHETDPVRRGAYHLASAEIRRSELKDRGGALACYDQALDDLLAEEPLSPSTRARAFDAFAALADLVTADEGWKQLEQAYRRVIKRLPKDDPALGQLWHALGDVYRIHLQHPQSAIEAFEVAHALDPDKSPQRARLLAELYAQVGQRQPTNVSLRAAKLVEVDPMNPDAYRALGRTALEAGRPDEAWCVSRALVFLKQASAEEEALYRRYRAHEVKKAKGLLDEDSWAQLRVADEDRAISAIFALVWEAPVALRAGPTKAFELKAKERMPVEEGTGVVAKIFRHAARVLNVALPDVYVQPRRSGRLLLANCIEKGRLVPAVIVGRDLMTGYRDTEIAAAVGAMLALLRPAYYLKLALGTLEELEAALAAAAALVGVRIGRPELEPLVTPFVAEMQKRVTRAHGEQLVGLVERLPAQLDLAKWRNSVDAAAQRAGLLVSGELAATARMISSEPTVPGGLRPLQRVQELIAYSVSPAYFALRRHLNVTVA
jgi:tetratricopeptide (TPR) repeat protein